jgi:hypothetical protein
MLSRHSALYDTDAYFHLAAGRRYLEEGLRGGLPWARFSVMHEGFGDKELLFHLLLAPLASWFGPTGGRFAVALLNGVIAGCVVRLAAPAVGAAAVVPLLLWMFLGSFDYLVRIVRLRPELLLLVWLLVAVDLAARRRHRLLAVVAFLLTWSHTGFPILLALCAAWAAADAVVTGRFEARGIAWAAGGMLAALLLHPQTPHHLGVWWVQNVVRYRLVLPDEGTEFLPNTLVAALGASGAWFAGAGAWLLWRGGISTAALRGSPLVRYLVVAALVFGVLFAHMARFATLFVPFASLALFYLARRREERGAAVAASSAVVRLARPAFAAALGVLTVGLGATTPGRLRATFADSGIHFPGFEPLGRQFGHLVPRGAAVAATVSDAQFYAFYAPWGRYLAVLDPAFMAVGHPAAYAAYQDAFAGSAPDVPLVAGTALASDYIAIFNPDTRLVGVRLAGDPRVFRANGGLDSLFALRTDANAAFALDWRVAPPGAPGPDASGWPAYPRAADPRARSLEGFVDLARVPPAATCRWLARAVHVADPMTVTYEFAPYGPGSVWLDGKLLVGVRGAPRAVLGQGALLSASLRDAHEIRVETCPAQGRNGFYLLERARGPAPANAWPGA